MWKEESDKLVYEKTFKDFKEGFEFLKKVAGLAEEMNHHPDLFQSWNKVRLELSTHSEGNKITQKDRKLADKISDLEK